MTFGADPVAVRRKLLHLLGDKRCAAKHASVAQLCGTGNVYEHFGVSAEACALFAAILISLAPLAFMPLLPTPSSGATATSGTGPSQPLLLCFACGGMLGDVFLHILPNTLGSGGHSHGGHEHGHSHGHEHAHSHGHSHEHSHEQAHGHSHEHGIGGLAVLVGFIGFFLVEKTVRSGHGQHSHGSGHSHDHGHSHGNGRHEAPQHDHAHVGGVSGTGACEIDGCEHDHGEAAANADTFHSHTHDHGGAAPPSGLRRRRASPAKARPATAAHAATALTAAAAAAAAASPPSSPRSRARAVTAAVAMSEKRIFGYLNLAADAAHNFTDGLALGAAFSSGFWPGVSMTLATLFHEVPHEVGDVAVLMQAGFSKAAAIKAQLGTALAAIMGTGVALAFGKDEENAKLLLNFAAGGFVYVATVDVLPALLQNKTSLKQTVAEVLAFAAGVSMMVMVGWLE